MSKPQIIITIDCEEDSSKWDMRNLVLETVKNVFVEYECVTGFKYRFTGVKENGES